MLRMRWLLLLFIMLVGSVAYGESLGSKPEWLQGKVAIDLYGDDHELGAWPYERYICIFNLDNSQTDSIKIPDNSAVLKEWEDGGRVVFVYPYTTGYNYMDDYAFRRWRGIKYVEIIPIETEAGTIYRRGESGFDFLNDDENNEKVFYDYLWMDSPLTILGLSGNDATVFDGMTEGLYLMYGLSEENEIELQLQRFDADGCFVLYHFPLDYDFGMWQCAISPGGKIAWWGDAGELLCVINHEVSAAHEEMYLNRTLTWRNDTELLFFATTKTKEGYALKKWDTSTGACEAFLNLTGKNIISEVYPWSMAVNDDGDVLAVFGSAEDQNVIQFINLMTGETYTVYPWTMENSDARSDFHWYGITDQGVMIYSPGKFMQSQLLWVSD